MTKPSEQFLLLLRSPTFQQLFPEGNTVRELARTLRLAQVYVAKALQVRNTLAHYAPRLREAARTGDLAGRKIVIFAYKGQWIDTGMAMALALAARGAEISVAWLPHLLAVPLPEPRAAVLVERLVAAAYRKMLPSTGPIRGIDLTSLPDGAATDRGDASLEAATRIDVHYLSKREQIQIRPGEAQHELYEFRLQRNARAYRLAHALLSRERFDSAIVPNGSIFEFASFVRACQDTQLDYVTFEYWEKRSSCVVNLDRRVFERFEETMWNLAPRALSDRARERVLKSMATREGTEWKDFLLRYQSAPLVPTDELRASLSLAKDKPIVLVLPNVPFDTAVIGSAGAFSTLRSWLEAVLRVLARRGDCQVVVRAHPAEIALGAEETAKQIYEQTLPIPPAHIRFIASDEKVNTYALMKMAAVGLVYSSTTGLELAMRGVPTVVATRTHYAEKGFTLSVEDEADLDGRIGELLASGKRMDQAHVDLAWAYADMYMNRWPRPFPFNLTTDFWRDVRPILDAAVRNDFTEDMRDTLTLFAGGERARTLYSRIAAKAD